MATSASQDSIPSGSHSSHEGNSFTRRSSQGDTTLPWRPPPIFTSGTGRGRFATRSGQAVTIRDVALPEIPIRIDPPLLRALRRRADTEGVSLNELIRRLLRDGLREQDAGVVGPPPVEADHVGDDTTLRRSA